MTQPIACQTLLLTLLAFTSPLAAQVAGRVSGSVLDPSGTAVPDARVSLLLAGGDQPVLSARTTLEGLFHLTGVRPEYYDLAIEARGFRKLTLRQVKVEPARETALPPIQLKVETVAEAVEVAAAPQGVQTTNAEISTTVTAEQVRRLPILDRNATALIRTQAGVSRLRIPGGCCGTYVNGQRRSFSNVTFDGINIQDNSFRFAGPEAGGLLLDQVGEFTISTSNTNAAVGGGASQITYVSPSGTNQFHGAGFWYNRNNAVAANPWFNNRDGIVQTPLNRNQAGGSLGGPIVRNKLLMYANYEAQRQHRQNATNRTILTADARRGIFTYEDLQGIVRKVDLLRAVGVGGDPVIEKLLRQVPGPEKINNFRLGDSRESLLRNTGGYSFLQRSNSIRDSVTGRLDYIHSTKNVLAASFAWNWESNDIAAPGGYTVIPTVFSESGATLVSLAWRWNPTPRFTNELRGGLNRLDISTRNSHQITSPLILPGAFEQPVASVWPFGRASNIYPVMDNAHLGAGRHNVQFGFQMQPVGTGSFGETNITPVYVLGSGPANPGLTGAHLPGIRALDLPAANNLLATLAGYVSVYLQNFYVSSRTSGFVDGAPSRRHYKLNNYALYAQDNWRLRPRLTLTLGVRYEQYSVPDERDGLALLPRIVDNNPVATLLSNATLDFAGSSAGRPWHRKDINNLAPNIGLAWDPFGNGKTALRAGYSISYVNDDTLAGAASSAEVNQGLSARSFRVGLSGRISALPAIEKPVFQVPRTFADNYRLDRSASFGLADPSLVTPYVQQWTFSIQRQFKGAVFEARYVGNHGVKLFRGFNYNQLIIRENGFLEDFLRAFENGNLARAATGVFNPAYNPTVSGSRPLALFPLLPAGGSFNDPTVRSLIETGQPGELARYYPASNLNGDFQFNPNPVAFGASILSNYSNSTYHGLQLEATRRARGGLQLQMNYTFSKALTDISDLSITRFDSFLDLGNPKIERARAIFDLTHAIKANAVVDLPFGEGRRLDFQPLRRLLGGWAASGILVWQSGGPFSVVSGRGTLNSAGNSGGKNTANTTLNKSQLDSLFHLRQTGVGPYFLAASAIGSDGRGFAPDGRAPFNGQVFFHPGPGTLGTLQQRMFAGPWGFNLDFGLLKNTKITERHSVELRMEAQNILNHPTWAFDDQSINSLNFGRILRTLNDRRLIQFGLYYRF